MSHLLVEFPKWLISEELSSSKYPIKKQRSDLIAFPISVLLGYKRENQISGLQKQRNIWREN